MLVRCRQDFSGSAISLSRSLTARSHFAHTLAFGARFVRNLARIPRRVTPAAISAEDLATITVDLAVGVREFCRHPDIVERIEAANASKSAYIKALLHEVRADRKYQFREGHPSQPDESVRSCVSRRQLTRLNGG